MPVDKRIVCAALLALSCTVAPAAPQDSVAELAAAFEAEVDHRLPLPDTEGPTYARLFEHALEDAGIAALAPQWVLIVDRDPRVQAALLAWVDPAGLRVLGASAASTGRPGHYEYFQTPLGVFRHLPGNPDFRAEGTRNDQGVRGYGVRGMRVFDFGWQPARRLWGRGGMSLMRLQLHATDPDLMESRVGTRQSKGCIRIPASLDRFLDRYGVLDADYEAASVAGFRSGLWSAPHRAWPGAGRYLVIVDSQRGQRPAWARRPEP